MIPPHPSPTPSWTRDHGAGASRPTGCPSRQLPTPPPDSSAPLPALAAATCSVRSSRNPLFPTRRRLPTRVSDQTISLPHQPTKKRTPPAQRWQLGGDGLHTTNTSTMAVQAVEVATRSGVDRPRSPTDTESPYRHRLLSHGAHQSPTSTPDRFRSHARSPLQLAFLTPMLRRLGASATAASHLRTVPSSKSQPRCHTHQPPPPHHHLPHNHHAQQQHNTQALSTP